MVNGEQRVANGKRFLEGSAPALPKIFGASRDAPSRFSPNEFGAQKIHHQPLAKASGMDKAVEQLLTRLT
jgi:hypothetical protein